VARARVNQQLAPLLPQVNGTASYARRAGAVPSSASSVGATGPGFNTSNQYNFGLNASQIVWDFGQKYWDYRSAGVNVEAQKEAEATALLTAIFNVRSAYLQAWAERALVRVNSETLANDQRHLEQVEGFVNAGSRPEIDLAQSRADRANAALQLANAEAGYDTAKAQLVLAMGLDAPFDFEVSDEAVGPVEGEESVPGQLLAGALVERPEVRSLKRQAESQHLATRADEGSYGPALSLTGNAGETGADLEQLRWSLAAGVTLTWQLFQGGITRATIQGDRANETQTQAQLRQEREQVRFDVTNGVLSVRSAKVAIATAEEVERNTREQLRLAEARYQAGAGSIIELQDAQVAVSNAAAQVIQAKFNLYLARAQLKKALGRR
jgi:outer membrane protein